MKLNIKTMCLCALFCVVITAGAFIKIPMIPVPITLQTLSIMLCAQLLGRKLAAITISMYLFIGLLGLPVFANGGGIGYVLQPSFGYLLGFLLCGIFVGSFTSIEKSLANNIVISFLGMVLISMCGILYFLLIQYFYFNTTYSIAWIFSSLFLVYLPGDMLSCVVGSVLNKRMRAVHLRIKTIEN